MTTSKVTHYKLQSDGTLKLVGVETVNYKDEECRCRPETRQVLSDVTVGGRREVWIKKDPRRRGRPVDPFKKNLLGCCTSNEVDRINSEMQYDGCCNADDEDVLDLLPGVRHVATYAEKEKN